MRQRVIADAGVLALIGLVFALNFYRLPVVALSLPAGPIWLLHLVYTAVSAFMLLVHVCWTPRVLTTWNARLPQRLGRRGGEHAGATTPTLFLDLDVLEFGDQASTYAGAAQAAPATLTARR